MTGMTCSSTNRRTLSRIAFSSSESAESMLYMSDFGIVGCKDTQLERSGWAVGGGLKSSYWKFFQDRAIAFNNDRGFYSWKNFQVELFSPPPTAHTRVFRLRRDVHED